MFQDLVGGIVRIVNPNGSTAGAGFVASDDGLVVTCSHVVEDFESQLQGKPKPEKVRIVFYATGDAKEATVDADSWRPADAEDLALLRVEGPLPYGVHPLPLGSSRGTKGHNFETFGFPEVNKEEGIPGDGHIVGETTIRGCPVVAINSTQVTPGFSGAPVWDRATRRVVGMVTKIAVPDAYGRLQETAFITPSDTLQKLFPDLRIADICPYRGLSAFTEDYAEFFFGRERLIEDLTGHLRRNPRFLAVVGSSGSGKSSLVQAGLFPRLHRGELPGFNSPCIVTFMPGDVPQASMRGALERVGFSVREDAQPLDVIGEYVEKHPSIGRVVLFIDQFEELFALASEEERNEFVRQLSLLVDGALPITLILTVRADFYDQLLRSPLGEGLRTGQFNARPMKSDELRAAIIGPAQAVGLQFESDLADQIIEGTSSVKHPLPLLEFALTQLWERRVDGLLTFQAYRSIGGVTGAIGQWASDTFHTLTEHERIWARRIFTRLVHYGEGDAPDTRRRLPLSVWLKAPEKQEAVHRAVTKLANARLLVTERDPHTEQASVEIIHDALLHEWRELSLWIREQREFLLWRQRLSERLREWEEKRRDKSVLLRGALLSEAQRWQGRQAGDLFPDEETFIEASRRAAVNRKRALTATAILGLTVVVGLALVALFQRNIAVGERQIALSRQLGAQSELIRNEQPSLLERSVLLAVESARRVPSADTDQTLREGLALLPRLIARMKHERMVLAVGFSPDGRYLATGSGDGTTRVWEATTGREVAHMKHEGMVFAVAFSPDGHYLATAGWDDTARVWEATSGREVARMKHEDMVFAIAFSPDGQYVATGSGDNTARLWKASSGQEVIRLKHHGRVFRLAFAPDGRYLATGSEDNSARVWKVTTGQEVVRLKHEGTVLAVAFSPDGQYLVTGSGDHTARLWRATSGQEVLRMWHESPVLAAAFSPDGRYLATASEGKAARMWEAINGRELARLMHKGRVSSVVFSPDGRYLATGSDDKTARVWESTSSREVARMTHEDEVMALAFSPDGRYLATGSMDKFARVWETSSSREVARMTHEGEVMALAFSSDGRYVATGSVDKTARVWETSSSREVARMTHGEGVNAVAFSLDGKYLATASSDRTVRVWEAASDREIVRIKQGGVFVVAFGPDGRYLAAASHDNIARVWESTSGREVTRMTHEGAVIALAFSPDGRYLATGSVDKTARVWETSSGREITRMGHEWQVGVVTFSPDGTYLATTNSLSSAHLWEASSGREVARMSHGSTVYTVAFSPDGKYLATASLDKTARVWEVPSGREVKRMRHDNQVIAAAFSPDGRYMATVSKDDTARVWEVNSGREVARMTQSMMHALAFSPDGRYLGTVSIKDQIARVWHWRPEDVVADACASLTRNFRPDEWRQYFNDEPYRKSCPNLP